VVLIAKESNAALNTNILRLCKETACRDTFITTVSYFATMSNKKLYWLCQFIGWFGMIVIETINYTFFIVGKFNIALLKVLLIYSVSGLLLTHLFKLTLSKTNFFHKSKASIWLIAVFSTFVLSVLMVVVNFIPNLFEKNGIEELKSLTPIYALGLVMNWMRYNGMWVIIYFMYKILQQNNAIIKEKLMIENLAKTTELELLKTQLNPHFLFNALNSIKALVIINPEQSRDAIVKLSELLRFTLQYGKERLIPIKDEVTEVKKYLELEQLRFGKRLTVEYNIDENTLSQTVPPAIVLTLAENAVKHGVTKELEDSVIVVSTSLNEDYLVIKVTNNGHYNPAETPGIGLKHITKRLDEIFQSKAEFSIYQEDKNVVAAIKIPFL
jgi:sensor histidine kinase YesM